MSVRLPALTAAACFLVPPLAAQATPSATSSATPTRIIECGTDSRQRVQCGVGGQVVAAKLIRDQSSRRCGPQGTWGWTDTTVWVDNGCRGEFAVTYRPAAGSENTRRITCGTLTSRQVTCKTEGYATSVRLVREISGNRCRKGTNWGNTDSFIWANSGCRAEFEVTYRDVGTPAPGQNTRVITCGTLSGTQVTCRTEGSATDVRLVRELSNNRCRKGSSWGNTDNFIWANRGCRAEFEVTYKAAPTTRTITCGTRTGSQVQCRTEGHATRVRLVRDLNNNRCRSGSTWGHTDSLIWANGGCRGEFEVTYREGGGMAPVTRRITCGTTSNAQVQCNVGSDANDVRLVRDLTGNQCRQGYNWGHVGAVIWANRGCRAEFEVTYRGGGLPDRPSPAPAPTKVITCGNAGGSAMSCNAFGTVANMRLQRDRSGGRCNQSSAWGLDDESIWVARGCYGDFEVTYTTTGRN
jgi:hypothetical protein